MIIINRLNRRAFLAQSSALLGQLALVTPPSTYQKIVTKGLPNFTVPVPPSLMLHSAEGTAEFFPYLLELLHQHGFQATTYQEWRQRVLAGNPIAKPVILSIDDITMTDCSAAFNTFVQMQAWLQTAAMTAVYAVITTPVCHGEPLRQQNPVKWDLMAEWVNSGFELATHTSYHSNFNARDTGPRPDFTAVDYEAEIVNSAFLIEIELANRGLDYRVETFITPYGSGYAYMLPQPQIHAGIVAACHQTHIKFVVGIVGGRGGVETAVLRNKHQLIYLGRTPPAYTATDQPDPTRSFGYVQSWAEANQTVL